MVSQESSQFLPLEAVEPLTSRPNRISHLVVQGKALDHSAIQSTINDCLLADDVLEMQQAQLRQQQQDLQLCPLNLDLICPQFQNWLLLPVSGLGIRLQKFCSYFPLFLLILWERSTVWLFIPWLPSIERQLAVHGFISSKMIYAPHALQKASLFAIKLKELMGWLVVSLYVNLCWNYW